MKVVERFFARMLADHVIDKPDELAAEHVKNDARLARGEALGQVIAEELRRAEIEHGPGHYRGKPCSSLGCSRICERDDPQCDWCIIDMSGGYG